MSGGTAITISGTAVDPVVNVDYSGTDNIVLSAGTAVTPVGADTIIINDATTGNVVKALVSNLPFDTYNKWVLTGDTGTQDILSGNTVDIAGGTYITTAAAATDTLTITHDDTSRTDTTSTDAPAFGGTFDAVASVTSNTQGHVTAVDILTVTLPSPVNLYSCNRTWFWISFCWYSWLCPCSCSWNRYCFLLFKWSWCNGYST